VSSGGADAGESKWESRTDGNGLEWESRVHRNGRGRRRDWGRSLATPATNRSRSVPRDTLVAKTLVDRGDGFGLVRAKELKRGTE
jgi:hypothetical protein